MENVSMSPSVCGGELSWLMDHKFQSITRRESDWLLSFDSGVELTIACLWRLTENDRILLTNIDDGHQFGHASRVDAATELNRMLANAPVQSTWVQPGLLDLQIAFKSGHTLQVIPDSSGYEAWSVSNGGKQVIALGGGEIAVI